MSRANRKASSAGAGSAGSRLRRMSPRRRCAHGNRHDVRPSPRRPTPRRSRERAVQSTLPEVDLGLHRLVEPAASPPHTLFAQAHKRLFEFGRAGRLVMKPAPRPNDKPLCGGEPVVHPMLPANSLQRLCRLQSRSRVAAQHFEKEFGLERMGGGRRVVELPWRGGSPPQSIPARGRPRPIATW